MIYYIIIICVYIVVLYTTAVTTSTGVSFNGLEIATLIYLFVSGLCAFKDNFLMLEQNSVSRKTMFNTRILIAFTICLIMAVIDKLLLTAFIAIAVASGSSIQVISLFGMLYTNAGVISTIWMHIAGLIFSFCFYLSVLAVGYFITVLFYRLNKLGRVAVGVGVPAFLCIGLPILNATVADGKIGDAYIKLMVFAMGISGSGSANQPSNAIISGLVVFAIFSLFGWLLIRKAAVR